MENPILITHTRRYSVENVILIWLDKNINELSDDTLKSVHLLQSYVNTIKLYSKPDECRQFIQQIKDEQLFIIVSGSLGEEHVPEMENNQQVYSIYVYCSQKGHHEKWTKDYQKVKGVYTDLQSICDALRRDVRQVTNDLIPIHLLPNRKSTELEQVFACSLLLREILINRPSNEQVKQAFIDYCRRQYEDNPGELNVIDHFEKTAYNQTSPIEWYTRECCLYSMIHRALRLYDMDILQRIAFFIHDLHAQIKDLHMKSTDHQKLTVFYGQGISNDQLTNFNMNINGLISFQNFLFTTIDRKPSLNFAKQSAKDSHRIPILFQIEIDRSKSSFPFVVLDELDYYRDTDRHILFSLNAVFRIIQIERTEEELWQINLVLVDDNDDKLKDLTHSIQTVHGKLTEFPTLGRMMTKTNQFDKAKQVFQSLLSNTSTNDDEQVAYIHRYLGYINEKTKDYSSALSHYQNCLHTKLRYLPPNDSSLSSIYAHIGLLEREQGNFDQALENFRRALKIDVHASKPNTSAIATQLNMIGALYISLKDYTAALHHLQEALKTLQRSKLPQHELSADIHHHLSIAFDHLGQYEDADNHASQAVNIASHKFGHNHPMLKKYQDQQNSIIQKRI